MRTSEAQGLSIALIGGGRWARVHADVLCSLYPRVARLLWVSRYNRDAIECLMAARRNPEITFFDSIDKISNEQVDAAVICTTTANHAADAIGRLESGNPVLVEKPIALNSQLAQNLVCIAKERKLSLRVCLPLLEASYLRRFKTACAGRVITSMQIRWFDIEDEARYGEIKRIDLSTHRVDEVIPHIWSLINVLLEVQELQVIATAVSGVHKSRLELHSGKVRISAEFGRRAAERERSVRLAFADGETAELDFSQEPGVGKIGGCQFSDDGSWATKLRPLAALHSSFLSRLNDPYRQAPDPIRIRECLGTVALADAVRHRIVAQDAGLVARWLRTEKIRGGTPALLHLLLENLGPELASSGVRIGPSLLEQRELCDAAASTLLSRTAIPHQPPARYQTGASALIKESNFIRQVRDELVD